ncbi:MAG TPA: efflux RND transporter periplasmic adaptor subunit [Deltaproteobacteria bacterium]|nr:efflux RND transporter periplasmic adaptor subunit [Deltaproteobacteria bacterium]HPR54225.1 efflux RND transporter periplasmic adaptor subunit [Deltaproteobacteria bacterium]
MSALLFDACSGQKPQQAPPPPEVGTITVREQEAVLTTELPGRTSAYRVAEVRPQVSGIVQKRLFEEGSDVRAGAVLYQIDPAPFQAAFESAGASLTRAEANIPAIRSRAERYRALLAERAVSQQDFDDVDSAFRQAEAEVRYWKAAVESARINLEYTRVTAPISGRTGRSNVTEGALVTASQPTPLVTIQQLDPIYVDAPQSTAELLRLKKRIESGSLEQNGTGQKKVRLILEDGSEYPLEGTFQFQDVTVERTTGSVTLRAVFPNPDGILLPGMFVRGVVQEGVNKQAILIPQHAVSRDPKGNPLALLVDPDGKVQERQISIDRAVGNQWLVTSGLAPGEKVIVEGMQKVRSGSPAKAVPAEEIASSGTAAVYTDKPAATTK